MGRVLCLLLVTLPAAAELEFIGAQAFKPLEFKVDIPAGFEVHHNHVGVVVMKKGPSLGFSVTRQPMLRLPDGFEEIWSEQLRRGGVKAAVEKTRVGGESAWTASWTAADGARVKVVRIHADENEMLYNLSFSASDGALPGDLVDGVLKSFKVTADKAKLVLAKKSVGDARVKMRLPEGFAQDAQPVRLGGGGGAVYRRHLPGYDPPHEAGTVSIMALQQGLVLSVDGGKDFIRVSDVKKVAEWAWEEAGKTLRSFEKKKSRSTRVDGKRGTYFEGEGVSREGLPKALHVYAVKLKKFTYVVSMIVDERETRLHGSYFKDILSKTEFKD